LVPAECILSSPSKYPIDSHYTYLITFPDWTNSIQFRLSRRATLEEMTPVIEKMLGKMVESLD